MSVGSGLACKSVRSRDITISAWSVSTGNRFGGEETLSRRVKLLMLQRRSNFQSTGNRFGGGVTSVKHSTTLCYVLVFCLKFTGSQFGSQLRYLKSFLPHVSPERGKGRGIVNTCYCEIWLLRAWSTLRGWRTGTRRTCCA